MLEAVHPVLLEGGLDYLIGGFLADGWFKAYFKFKFSPGDAGLPAEFIGEVFGVVFGEVAVEIVHGVQGDTPDVVLEVLQSLPFYQLLLNDLPDHALSGSLNSCEGSRPVKFLLAGDQFNSCEVLGHCFLKNIGDFMFGEIPGSNSDQIVFVPFYFFVVLHGGETEIFLPFETFSGILAYFLFVDVLVDYMLLVRNKMKPGAGKFEVVEVLAELARFYLELIGDVPAFVSEEAVELVVHIAFSEYLYKSWEFQREEDWELQGFYLVAGSCFGYEVEAGQKGQVLPVDFDLVNDAIIETASVFLADVTEMSLSEDYEVKIIIEGFDNLLRVGYPGLELFWEVVEGSLE